MNENGNTPRGDAAQAAALPSPPLPADCDLRGMEWMPLYGGRLFGSDFDAHATDAEFRAGVQLWWAAWNQVPAASLPDDDVALCRLAGLGRQKKAWHRVKNRALHGFSRCSDGRFYHRALAAFAQESWDRRLKDRERKAKWREENERKKKKSDGDQPSDGTGTGAGTERGRDADTGRDGTADETRRDKTGRDATRSDPPSSGERASRESGRAGAIGDDWEPTGADLAALRKLRPDVVGELYAQRMQEFRRWCREQGVTSHNPAGTWLGFMRRSPDRPAETYAERKDRENAEAIARGLKEAS